jgi:hypothetical protein
MMGKGALIRHLQNACLRRGGPAAASRRAKHLESLQFFSSVR